MLTTLRSTRRRHAALWRFATGLALLAQCWIAVAAFGDARGLGASAHVEATGVNQHYAHDEADCAACRTLALSALPLLAHAPAPPPSVVRTEAPARPLTHPRAESVALTRTRAPPSVA